MDRELKVKVAVKKIGAELIRVQKRMEVVEIKYGGVFEGNGDGIKRDQKGKEGDR